MESDVAITMTSDHKIADFPNFCSENDGDRGVCPVAVTDCSDFGSGMTLFCTNLGLSIRQVSRKAIPKHHDKSESYCSIEEI